MFSSVELEWLGLEDKKSSASWSEFFLRRFFLIKGRWFMAVLSRGNPVPCYPNMHFLAEIERTKSVAVDTFFCDQVKYLFLRFFEFVYKIDNKFLFLITHDWMRIATCRKNINFCVQLMLVLVLKYTSYSFAFCMWAFDLGR